MFQVKFDLPFKNTPEVYRKLWEGNSKESKTFKEHSRRLNNVFALASIKLHEVAPPDRSAFRPGFVIQGKIHIRAGPATASDGDVVCGSLLYVIDPPKAKEIREGHIPIKASKEEKLILKNLIEKLRIELQQSNPLIQDYVTAAELIEEGSLPENVTLVLEGSRPDPNFGNQHERRWNAPTGLQEIAALVDARRLPDRDFLIQKRGRANEVRNISFTNRFYDPMYFVLFHPTGSEGWQIGLFQDPSAHARNRKQPKKETRSIMKHYAYVIQVRVKRPFQQQPGILDFNPLHWGKRLFQEYLVLQAVKQEANELKYLQSAEGQKTIKAEKYHILREFVRGLDTRLQVTQPAGDSSRPNSTAVRPEIGKTVILPSTFVGSDRYMHKKLQNAIALMRELGAPSLFITATPNPSWPEIVNSLYEGQCPRDRSDIIARVFHMKLKQLIFLIEKKQIFGRVIGRVHTIEFQKRGLPHVHLIVILHPEDRAKEANDVETMLMSHFENPEKKDENGNAVYSAEERKSLIELNKLVALHMCHTCRIGQCKEFWDSPCKRRFPKSQLDNSLFSEEKLYCELRRPFEMEVAIVRNGKPKTYSDADISTFSPFLIKKFNCHINVEYCTSPHTAKYLFKYIMKGQDMITVRTVVDQQTGQRKNVADYNEIEVFHTKRYIGAAQVSLSVLC